MGQRWRSVTDKRKRAIIFKYNYSFVKEIYFLVTFFLGEPTQDILRGAVCVCGSVNYVLEGLITHLYLSKFPLSIRCLVYLVLQIGVPYGNFNFHVFSLALNSLKMVIRTMCIHCVSHFGSLYAVLGNPTPHISPSCILAPIYLSRGR